ncbi:MAG TPA: tetratricopeptide repeat protein [Gemmataceae bacterium]|nr:tetratricopeptide repeat protein [Gemmataceae bacterium]
MSSDSNLLFGVLAFQAGLIDAKQFASACSLWCAGRELPLAQILVDQGWLTPKDRDHIAYLLERNLQKHEGDEQASLAAAADAKIVQILQSIKDPVIEHSLASLPHPEGYVLLSTRTYEPEHRERYTLTRLHAEGGIGQVWLARDSDLSREVALKELKPERAENPGQWDRFLEEARLTSQLQHPGIVPVYELARRSDSQQPFYTMRFVKGRTLRDAIKTYHEHRAAGVAELLEGRALIEAFVGVCHAIAYAHSRGVIHRDLKPQNVVLGDFGEVIVLDWGLAKVIDHPEGSLDSPPVVAGNQGQRDDTVQGHVLGTPAYMSPEQAAGRVDLIGRSSDVYGLGAILFQILTDKPPFTGSSTDEVLQRVRSIAPPAPRELAADVPPALEAVCLRALAKFPQDRYASAEDLGNEIKRWLADEPVRAYREPVLVRAGRWARRHRTAVASVAVLLVTLVVASSVGMVLVTREKNRTAQQAAISRALNDFLNDDLLAQADPRRMPDKDLKVRTLLDRAKERLDGRFPHQPVVEARVRNTLGSAYLSLGDFVTAESLLRAARALYESNLPAEDRTRLRSNAELGFALFKLGSPDAEKLLSETLAVQKRVLDADDPDALRTMIVLAHVLDDRPPYEESQKIYEEVLAAEKRTLGDTDPATLMTQTDLAVNLKRRGHSEDARKLLEDTLATQKRTLKPNDLDLLSSMNNLASALESLGRYAESLKVSSELLPLQKQSLPVDHPDIANSMMSIANNLSKLGQYEQSLKMFEETIAVQKRSLPDGHQRTLVTMRGYANLLSRQGHREKARTVFEETISIQERTLPPGDPQTLATMRDLGILLDVMGQSEAALKLKEKILAIRRLAHSPTHSDTLEAMRSIAISKTNLGRNREALQMYEEILSISLKAYQAKDSVQINAINGMAWFLATVPDKELRDPKRAQELAKQVLDLDPSKGDSWNSYGVAQYSAGDWQGALKALTESVRLRTNGGDSFDYFFLAMAHWQLGHKEEAASWYKRALAWMEKFAPKDPELVRFRSDAEELMGVKKK